MHSEDNTLKIVGGVDEPAGSRPLAVALAEEDKALSELDMCLSLLEARLTPVTNGSRTIVADDGSSGPERDSDSSSMVRAVSKQTAHVRAIIDKVKNIIDGLDV